MRIFIIDNYDSFTYNLLHILKEFGADVEVYRNDRVSMTLMLPTASFSLQGQAFLKKRDLPSVLSTATRE